MNNPGKYLPRMSIGHAVHLLVLLLPAMMLQPILEWDWSIVIFASLIACAALLESLCVADISDISKTPTRDPLAIQVAALVGVLLLTIFWIAQVEHILIGRHNVGIQVTGGLMVTTGIFLRSAAICTLGESFVSDIRCSDLVDVGVYRWLSHPGEIGMLLIVVGAAILLLAPGAFLIAIFVVCPISWWRLRRENAILESKKCPTQS